VYEATQEEVNFAGFSLGGLLSPLRTLTFWKMKDRAKKFGETAGTDCCGAFKPRALHPSECI
jgi:hypothetical protein